MRYLLSALLAVGVAGSVLVAPGGLDAAPIKPRPADPALKASVPGPAGLTWGADLSAALELAAKDKQLVFIDFTGVTCTNCRVNEKAVFTRPEVKELFARYARVELYTDEVPAEFYKQKPSDEQREADAEVNRKFQKEHFKTEQLPLYAIVRPVDGGFETVATYDEGRISKVDAFVAFLKKPLAGGKE